MSGLNIYERSQTLLDELNNKSFSESLFNPHKGGSINDATHHSTTTMVVNPSLINDPSRLCFGKVGGGPKNFLNKTE